MSLGRWTNEPAPALKVVSPTMTSSSPSSTQKASSSRWWMWGGGPPPGGTTESVSAYAPPVSSPTALKVISSSATQSVLPSSAATCNVRPLVAPGSEDRKSTRLNSSHANISYAVFCLKKKKETTCTSCA